MINFPKSSKAAQIGRNVRVRGNRMPSHLHGRHRSFWISAMGPKADHTVVEITDADVATIMTELQRRPVSIAA